MMNFQSSLVIIPTYNEIDNIHNMITSLTGLYPDLSILIIDDGSPDGTGAEVEKMQKNYPKLHLMKRSGKLGLGTAYIAGFKWGIAKGFEYLFQMDCDFSHDPKDLQTLRDAIEKNDLVIGSRYIGGIRVINWPIHRLLLSYTASFYTRFITGLKIFDTTGGFKSLRSSALKSIDLERIFSNGYSFQIEMNFRFFCKHFRIQEVPIIFYERRDGQSKMDFSIVKEAIGGVLKLRLLKLFGYL